MIMLCLLHELFSRTPSDAARCKPLFPGSARGSVGNLSLGVVLETLCQENRSIHILNMFINASFIAYVLIVEIFEQPRSKVPKDLKAKLSVKLN